MNKVCVLYESVSFCLPYAIFEQMLVVFFSTEVLEQQKKLFGKCKKVVLETKTGFLY